MAQAPPILIYEPGGGVSTPIGSNPPVYSQAGTTALVEDQDYVDVVFGSIQTTDDWVLTTCAVENEIDVDPLNIWPGIITERTAAGFRIYLNGLPDSGNYYLHWAVTGVNIEPSVATTYFLTGPATGAPGEEATFTVSLPPSTTVAASLTVTPSETGLEIGVFSPETVTLTTDSPSETFTFTPAVYGDTGITVNNDRGLTDPEDLDFSAVADTYTMSGPSSGTTGVASTDFTVELPVGGVVAGTVTVTPSDGGGGGTFTPTTATLTTVAPSDTFTYTPASNGTKTISVTNDGGLTNPGNLSYVASTPVLPTDIAGLIVWLDADNPGTAFVNGDPVPSWADGSGNANHFIQVTAGLRPTFKTNRINGLPAIDFDGSDDRLTLGTLPATITTAVSVFVVQRKNANSATLMIMSEATSPTNSFAIYLPYSDGTVYFDLGDTTATGRVSAAWGGNFSDFFCWSFVAGGGNMAIYRNGTTVVSSGSHTNSFNSTGLGLAINGSVGIVQDADITEVVIYNNALGTTDRQNIENYLMDKYGL